MPKDTLPAATAATPMVFSIRAEYCARILDGSKRWEFRTRCPRIALGERAIIYESRGRGRIVASFARGVIFEARPDMLWGWGEVASLRGIERAAYDAYFKDRRVAFAMALVDVRPLDMPLPAGMRAPQSWARLREASS